VSKKYLSLNLLLLTLVVAGNTGCRFFKNITGPSEIFSGGGIKYYGYYFVEDPNKGLSYSHEIADFANMINVRSDNGVGNSWDPVAASKIKSAGLKAMLQIPFGGESDQTLFVDQAARSVYLAKIREDMINTNFIHNLAYIAVYEEWYVLISQGHYDSWPIFQGRGREEKFAIAKQYLEVIIGDIHRVFPGIPTVIVENILPLPPLPDNLDIVGVDAYYIPTSPDCDVEQKAMFDSQVLPHYDATRPYNKPVMMVAPSFIHGPWKMLSACQMQWYADLAVNGPYNIESFLWFLYDLNDPGFTGVRSFPELVAYQRGLASQLLGK